MFIFVNMGTRVSGLYIRYLRIFVLLFFNLFCINGVECGGFFSSGTSGQELLAQEDLTECSWCVKQMAKDLMLKLKSSMKDSATDVELRIKLTRQDIEKLDEFVSTENSWIDVDEILKMINPDVYIPSDQIPHYPNGLSPSTIIMMSTGGVTICAMWMILSRQSITLVTVLLILLCFSVGMAWNWWKLYKEEYSLRVTQLPDECKPDEATWYHSVKGFLIDPNCGDYFKAPVDDPVAMVSPHKVITETIAMIFVSPISMVASTFTTFIHSLTDNLMWPFNWIAQIALTVFLIAAVTVLAITLLAGLFNLDMKFSTCLVSGELKPSKTRPRTLRLSSACPSPSSKGGRKRPTDLSLFPAPPSPFR